MTGAERATTPVALMNRFSLRTQVVLISLVCMALGLFAAFVGSFRAGRSVIMSTTQAHLQSQTIEALDASRRHQKALSDAVAIWANTEAMQLSLDSKDSKFAEDYLLRAATDPGFALAMLVDQHGTVVTAVRPTTADHAEVVASLKGVTLEVGAADDARAVRLSTERALLSVVKERNGVLLLKAPVRDFAGDAEGQVVAIPSRDGLNGLLKALAQQAQSGAQTWPVLYTADQQYVVSPWPGARSAVQAIAQTLSAPRVGDEALTLELEGERWFVAGATRPENESPRWAVALLVREADALRSLETLRDGLALAFTLILLVVGVTSVLVMRRAARPLKEIGLSMNKVAEGDLSIRLPPQRASDMARLVSSFNAMVEEVSRSRDSLKKTEALRREVEIAHRIQTTLLPATLTLPGFDVAARSRPASEVGGDFYDVVPLEAGRFWLIAGDVSGHGLNAGLIMLMVQAAAQAAVRAAVKEPTELLSEINAVLFENVRQRMKSTDYVTLFVALHTGDGRFEGAGSCPPLFVRRANGTQEIIDVRGPWCGVAADISKVVTKQTFELQPQDSLVLLTDGFLEAQNPAGELFGEDRVTQQFAELAPKGPQAVIDGLFSVTDAFAPEQNDDMTAFCLRRQ